MTSVVLVLTRIPVDPPREDAPEPTAITEAESDCRYALGAGLPRTYNRDNAADLAHHLAHHLAVWKKEN